ncbi:nitroreductase family deazaflavin-dependent oxidoreductase [Nocardioides sp. AE5]|uniref:nitroreductase family deazaflavin-dependent oxidoreductase n=1 Tax=Nocardioides sp. AE5 TaxID=2962573 RepID=UPI002882B9E4|nr:nitroreductase family deazaflavin-dependent oxidoreductase [Nocardioides sp. AE5]MDT0202495.1 nitroreductase family deazaflavin-dependent oxidoreductase [Nocardioides sp. AE5]
MYELYARLVRPLAILLGGQAWLPRLNRQIVAMDRVVQKFSRGRIGFVRIAGLPGLTLTVAGRKSGVPRSTPLLCVPHGDGWLVAGSNWGAPKPPVWVANLSAATSARVNFEGRSYDVVPSEAVGEERDRLFAVMNQTWPNYRKYEKRTERTIRVFELRRA